MSSASRSGQEYQGGNVYDIPRQSSRCKVIVYSHVTKNENDRTYDGVLDCTPDVIQCQTSKTIKGGGGAAVVLVPRRNYLNYIFPNDVINIYFDPGDGRGYIRTFFGYVDRIDRSSSVDQNGATTTRFQLTCTDFTKAFAKAFIHFAPHLAERSDFVTTIFGKNIGGAALRTKGVSIMGNPADVVASISFLVLGFGAQFKLPKSYPLDEAFVNDQRRRKLIIAANKLPRDIREIIATYGIEKFEEETRYKWRQLRNRVADEILDPISRVRNFETSFFDTKGEQLTPAQAAYWSADGLSAQYEIVNSQAFGAVKRQHIDILNLGKDYHVFDLIDFRLMEFHAIDGSILATPIWSSSGPVWNVMNSWSNDMINELFCDLRPVNYTKKKEFVDGAYTKAPDEIRGNVGGSGQAVKYLPSLIMREHPWATIEGVPPGPQPVLIFDIIKLGSVPFGGKVVAGATGGLFSQQPNASGRRAITIKALNPYEIIAVKDKAQAQKHLDVATISVQDIISERIGRSDADVVNLIEVFSDAGLGIGHQFLTQEVQPIASPISIIRDGLRIRRYTTKFARWPSERYKSDGVDSAMTRFQTIRWAMLLDHWFQHNAEYLNGTISTRAFPEIRVGYRLDIVERNESYYVEGTNHSWNYTEQGGMLTSAFTLSRGQRNDPFPVYVTPALPNFGGHNNRDIDSRLAIFFNQLDPSAVKRSQITIGEATSMKEALRNTVDIPSSKNKSWSGNKRGYLAAGSAAITSDEDLKQDTKKKLDAALELFDKMGLGFSWKEADSMFDTAIEQARASKLSTGKTK